MCFRRLFFGDARLQHCMRSQDVFTRGCRLGVETFAFDPASNLLDEKNQQVQRPLDHDPKRNTLMDNLLREYAGSHYDYDERGNQIRRWHNGQQSRLHWDLFDRLVRFENSQLSVDYAYDPLGRRL